MPAMRVEKHVQHDAEGSHNAIISSPNILCLFLFDLVIWKLFCRLNNRKQLEFAEDEKCAIRINYFKNISKKLRLTECLDAREEQGILN